jgi:hypothetical protein
VTELATAGLTLGDILPLSLNLVVVLLLQLLTTRKQYTMLL